MTTCPVCRCEFDSATLPVHGTGVNNWCEGSPAEGLERARAFWDRPVQRIDVTALSVPGLEPGPLTSEDYMAGTPEKLEFVGGYLIGRRELAADRHEALLRLLLVNVGLRRAVQLAPRESWEQALGDRRQ